MMHLSSLPLSLNKLTDPSSSKFVFAQVTVSALKNSPCFWFRPESHFWCFPVSLRQVKAFSSCQSSPRLHFGLPDMVPLASLIKMKNIPLRTQERKYLVEIEE